MKAHPSAKPVRQRSPRHPAISLPASHKRAKTLQVAANEQAVTIGVALECWGYQPASSIGLQNISALREFGLIENVGPRDRHLVRLTPLALKLLDERIVTKHAELLRVAALLPKLHGELWRRFDGKLPSDEVLRGYLVDQRTAGKFNSRHVDRFLTQYRETLWYAQMPSQQAIERQPAEVFSSVESAVHKSTPNAENNVSDEQEFVISLGKDRDAKFRLPVPLTNEEFTRIIATLVARKEVWVRQGGTSEVEATATAEPSRRRKPKRDIQF